MIKENPLFGSGLGGFRGYNNIEWTNEIKYPHNLFLEITSECGFVGLFILVELLLVIFRNVYRFSFSDLQFSSQISPSPSVSQSPTPSISPLTFSLSHSSFSPYGLRCSLRIYLHRVCYGLDWCLRDLKVNNYIYYKSEG
jgi:hypothetical protein